MHRGPTKEAEAVLSAISAEETLALTRLLLSVSTHVGDDGKLSEPLKAWLEGRRIPARLQEAAPGRPNVLARLRGQGSGAALMLMGHLDIPHLMGQWTVDPYQGVFRNGRVYGSGIRDMKGGVAAMAIAADAVQRAGIPLKGDVVLAFVVGHLEHGLGCHALEATETADFAVVGEPTDLELEVGHRGWVNIDLTVRGKLAHTTRPERGVSAIEKMAKVVLALQRKRFRPARLSPEARRLFPGPVCYQNVGLIRGGIAPNRIAPECTATMDVRYVPGKVAADVLTEVRGELRRLHAADPRLRAEAAISPGYPLEAYLLPPASPLVGLMHEVAAAASGRRRRVVALAGTTDAGMLYQEAGIPSVICGPALWPYEYSDESLPLDDILTAARLYALTILRVTGTPRDAFRRLTTGPGRAPEAPVRRQRARR
ncbi:MAG: M20/M25/M40 family metallo-hydrolase [Candidatus Rokubacteria bacterium]|nr:M20/M25/M40 family metallo-hydrolase [Candidatus Rokubacteria bacterium]